MKEIYKITDKFIEKCNEINNAEHNETMHQFILKYSDGFYVYFDVFDQKDGGYCQFVLHDPNGYQRGFTDPLNGDEIEDIFELDNNHILIVKKE